MNELDLLDVKKSPDGERSPLRMGQNVLFRHGVQIRLSFAILLSSSVSLNAACSDGVIKEMFLPERTVSILAVS